MGVHFTWLNSNQLKMRSSEEIIFQYHWCPNKREETQKHRGKKVWREIKGCHEMREGSHLKPNRGSKEIKSVNNNFKKWEKEIKSASTSMLKFQPPEL